MNLEYTIYNASPVLYFWCRVFNGPSLYNHPISTAAFCGDAHLRDLKVPRH